MCPVTLFDTWDAAKKANPQYQKFFADPKKFAKVNQFNSSKVLAALKDYENSGSGKYRSPQERASFKNAALLVCNAPENARNVRVVDVRKEERCDSCHIEFGPSKDGSEYTFNGVTDELGFAGGEVQLMETRSLISISDDGDWAAFNLETEDELDSHRPQQAPLHLLLATRVESATEDDIREYKKGARDEAVAKINEEDIGEEEFKTGCLVRLRMPYGSEYVVPYTKVQGRILADTGSTTTLINEDFAIRRGLELMDSPKEITLRDVNNGYSTLTKQCYLRLTLTTIWGDHITATLQALCVKDLRHDLLLGMRDLHRYKVSVMPHRGEVQMQVGEDIEIFPMLDCDQIKKLQDMTKEGSDEC